MNHWINQRIKKKYLETNENGSTYNPKLMRWEVYSNKILP